MIRFGPRRRAGGQEMSAVGKGKEDDAQLPAKVYAKALEDGGRPGFGIVLVDRQLWRIGW
jgi:hypothetical protein